MRRHNVAADPPPPGRFDVVHARLVLIYVPARDQALRHMVTALRPGGLLLVEDFDIDLQPSACLYSHSGEERPADQIRAGFIDLLAARGADPCYGRSLPGRFRDLRLHEVGADAYFPLAHPAAARLEMADVEQVRDQLIAHGHVTPGEVEAHPAAARRLDLTNPPLVSAWGRRKG